MAVRLPCNSLPGTFRVPAAKRKARVRSTGSHLGPNTTSGRLRIRMCYPALFGGRQTAEGFPPLQRLTRGDPIDGERSSHKSCRRRADAQWIVTTRLLYHLHDPAELISRMQRIYPRALSNCHTSAGDSDFHRDAVADLLRFRAKRPIRILVRCAERDRHVLAWILT